jgi:hypothetical protein
MLRILLGLASLAVLASGLRAQQKPPTPPVPPPLQGTAQVQGKNLRCVVHVMQYVMQQRAKKVVQGGKVVVVVETVMVPVYRAETRLIPLAGVEAYITGGAGGDPTKRITRLDATKLPKLLEKNTRALFILDGRKVDPQSVKAAKEGTIVLVLPRAKQTEPKKETPRE